MATASTQTIPSVVPRHGVITLFGYGIQVRVDRGHLILEDGIGADRRSARLPRVGHGLRRLVVIGPDGMVTLSALRWLADQRAAFVMLDRDGSVLTSTGPIPPNDARLRRAQARADQSGVAMRIVRELIGQKLAGQERVARDKLGNSSVAKTIATMRVAVASAETIQTARVMESQAGLAYWSAWRDLPINFPKNDLARVPAHWRVFATRHSQLTNSPRLAANPVNAILNFLYALLEAESRLAAAALGLDPGIGFLHADTKARDSLACDLMEPVRPQVDALVLDWIARSPLRREWFFEQRTGNCRLMAPFACQLAETIPTWRRAVAPYAERIMHALWLTTSRSARQPAPATRLTQSRKREVKGAPLMPPAERTTRPQKACQLCGASISPENTYCVHCAATFTKDKMTHTAKVGRLTALTPEAQAKRSETQQRHARAVLNWKASDQPAWLNHEAYLTTIQPLLAGVTRSAIVAATGVSVPYAAKFRTGHRIPHPRHWRALAQLVGVLGHA